MLAFCHANGIGLRREDGSAEHATAAHLPRIFEGVIRDYKAQIHETAALRATVHALTAPSKP